MTTTNQYPRRSDSFSFMKSWGVKLLLLLTCSSFAFVSSIYGQAAWKINWNVAGLNYQGLMLFYPEGTGEVLVRYYNSYHQKYDLIYQSLIWRIGSYGTEVNCYSPIDAETGLTSYQYVADNFYESFDAWGNATLVNMDNMGTSAYVAATPLYTESQMNAQLNQLYSHVNSRSSSPSSKPKTSSSSTYSSSSGSSSSSTFWKEQTKKNQQYYQNMQSSINSWNRKYDSNWSESFNTFNW